MQLGRRELGRAINGDKEIKSSLFGANFGDLQLEVANGIFGELPLRWLFANLRSAANAVTRQTALQTGASQLRNARLQRVKASGERQ